MLQNYSVTHKEKRKKWDLQIVSVINENLTHIPTIFLKLIFIFNFRNTTIVLTVTIHIISNVNVINAERNKHICKKKFLLALLCSIASVYTAFDALVTILVMVPVDAVFSGGYKPITPIQPTLALHLTLRFRLSHNRDKLALLDSILNYIYWLCCVVVLLLQTSLLSSNKIYVQLTTVFIPLCVTTCDSMWPLVLTI